MIDTTAIFKEKDPRFITWLFISFLINLFFLAAILYFLEQKRQIQLQEMKVAPTPQQLISMYKTKQINAPKGNTLGPSSMAKQAIAAQQPSAPPPSKEKAEKTTQSEEALPEVIKAATTQQKVSRPKRKKIIKKKIIKKIVPNKNEQQATHDPTQPTLADIAKGFMNYQQQQDQRITGITNGNINGDMAMMKYASYFSSVKQHLQTALNVCYQRLSPTEKQELTKQKIKPSCYFLEWNIEGHFIQVSLIDSSRNEIHDRATRNIIEYADPLPKIPPSLELNTITLKWNFFLSPGHYTDANAIPSSFGYT